MSQKARLRREDAASDSNTKSVPRSHKRGKQESRPNEAATPGDGARRKTRHSSDSGTPVNSSPTPDSQESKSGKRAPRKGADTGDSDSVGEGKRMVSDPLISSSIHVSSIGLSATPSKRQSSSTSNVNGSPVATSPNAVERRGADQSGSANADLGSKKRKFPSMPESGDSETEEGEFVSLSLFLSFFISLFL